MAEPRDRAKRDFGIPDLELPPARPSQGGMGAVRIQEKGTRSSGSALDDLELPSEHALPVLDLTDGPISGTGAAFPFSDSRGLPGSDFELEPALPLDTQAGAAVELAANWPTGKTPARERLILDSTEIRKLAGYGEAPPLFAAPAYALRVAARQRQLLLELRRTDAELEQAEGDRERLLAELAQRLRPELEGSDTFRRLLAPMVEVDRLTREQSSDQARAEAARRTEQSRTEAERQQLQSELDSATATESKHRSELEEAERQRERTAARHKRCFIELRAIDPPAEAGRGQPSEAASERVRTLRQQAETLARELQTSESALSAVRARHHESMLIARESKRRLDQLDRERAAGQAKQPSAASSDDADLERRSRLAFADVGRAVLALRGAVPVDPAMLRSLHQADQTIGRLLMQSEMYLRALDAGDRERVRQGFGLLGVMGAALLVLLVWALL